MRILHILAHDSDETVRFRFRDVILELSGAGVEQRAILGAKAAGNGFADGLPVAVDLCRFSGLFDLRTQGTLSRIAGSFKPHIIQSHSPDAAWFVSKIRTEGQSSIHAGLAAEGNAYEEKIAALCPYILIRGRDSLSAQRTDGKPMEAASPSVAPPSGAAGLYLRAYETILRSRKEEKTGA